MKSSTTTVGYKITNRELLINALWRDIITPSSVGLSCICLIFAIWGFTSGIIEPIFSISPTLGLILGLSHRAYTFYTAIKSNPLNNLSIKMSFGETGFIIATERSRHERTWQSLYSWSQSRNYFYLNIDKAGNHILIPKRAFTDVQIGNFRMQLNKVEKSQSETSCLTVVPAPSQEQLMPVEHLYKSPQTLHEGKASSGQINRTGGRVFLSYAREDVDMAVHLFNDLRNAGIDIWLDKASLLPGQKWKAEVRQAIKESRFFLALLSNNSVSKKGFVQNELKHAFEMLDEYPESAIFVIPVRLDNCYPSKEELKELHWIDIFEDWEEGVARIIRTIESQNNI